MSSTTASGALLELVGLPLGGGGESEVIEHAWPEVRGDATDGHDRVVDERRHGGELAGNHGGIGLHVRPDPRHVHLECSQRLAEHIVDLAGHGGPFLLPRRQQPFRQVLQLRPRLFHRLAAPAIVARNLDRQKQDEHCVRRGTHIDRLRAFDVDPRAPGGGHERQDGGEKQQDAAHAVARPEASPTDGAEDANRQNDGVGRQQERTGRPVAHGRKLLSPRRDHLFDADHRSGQGQHRHVDGHCRGEQAGRGPHEPPGPHARDKGQQPDSRHLEEDSKAGAHVESPLALSDGLRRHEGEQVRAEEGAQHALAGEEDQHRVAP